MGGSTRKHAKARRRLFGKKTDTAALHLLTNLPPVEESLPLEDVKKEELLELKQEESLEVVKCLEGSCLGVEGGIPTNLWNNNQVEIDNCLVCGAESSLFCSACREATYCSTDHQLKHWTEVHSKVCYPCQDMEEEDLVGWIRPFGKGPYLKATKDVAPFEVIYEDRSLITGPGCSGATPYEPVCLGCNEILTIWKLCSLCGWPLCSENCPKKIIHLNYECPIFARNGVQELYEPFQYELVRILRCLLTRSKDPGTFHTLTSLHGALEVRLNIDSLIEATRTATMFIQQNCNLVEFDESVINQICGVVHLQTRPFGKSCSSMEIFPFTSKLLHACDANTRFIDKISPTGETLLQVIAIREVKKGEPLTQRLLVDIEPTFLRQRYLKEHYYFTCTCALCKDPTERSTYFSAVKCYTCKTAGNISRNAGYLLPLDPTDIDSVWECNLCKASHQGTPTKFRIESCVKRFIDFQEKNVQKSAKKDSIVALRKKIAEAEEEFHPSMFVVCRLKQNLAATLSEHLLTMTAVFPWDEIHATFTELHEAVIRSLTIMQLLQPGSSVERGKTVYDLVVALWAYSQWAVNFQKSSTFEATANEKGFDSLASEVIKIFEPEVASGSSLVADAVKFIVSNTDYIKQKMEELGMAEIVPTEKLN